MSCNFVTEIINSKIKFEHNVASLRSRVNYPTPQWQELLGMYWFWWKEEDPNQLRDNGPILFVLLKLNETAVRGCYFKTPYYHARSWWWKTALNKNDHSCSTNFYFRATNVKSNW